MGYAISTKGKKIADARKGGFPPLEKGPIGVTVFKAEVGEYGPKSANAGRPNLKVQLRVMDDQVGANRRVFDTIPLFTEWAPTEKNPDGADAFAFFQFFAAIEGISESEFRAKVREAAEKDEDFEIPDPSEILGKELTAVLTIENDRGAYNKAKEEGTLGADETEDDYKTNRVRQYKPFEGLRKDEVAEKAAKSTKKYKL